MGPAEQVGDGGLGLLEAAAPATGDGPLAQVAFSAAPVTNQRSWLASDRQRGRALMLELFRAGVFLNPMGTKLYLSLAHDDAAIDQFARHFATALKNTRASGRTETTSA